MVPPPVPATDPSRTVNRLDISGIASSGQVANHTLGIAVQISAISAWDDDFILWKETLLTPVNRAKQVDDVSVNGNNSDS